MSTLIGKKAPAINASAAMGDKTLNAFTLEQFAGKYVVLFFYPLDFTFVCPTELHAFQSKLQAFRQRGCEVVGCSVDSVFSHHAWLKTAVSKGGIEGVSYPIISDIHKSIARDYGVLCEAEGVAYRGLFLIDQQGLVRHQLVNDLPLGRSVDEALRMLDALIYFEQNGEVCPANWNEGSQAMTPTQEGLEKFFATSSL